MGVVRCVGMGVVQCVRTGVVWIRAYKFTGTGGLHFCYGRTNLHVRTYECCMFIFFIECTVHEKLLTVTVSTV